MLHNLRQPGVMTLTLSAAGILLLMMGIRQSTGLYLSPINTSTGLGIVSLSFALAIGQFVWGAIQPIAGAMADHWGPRPVLLGGVLLFAAAIAATPFMTDGTGFAITLGILSAAGAGSASFSVLMGVVAQRLPVESRGSASGIINAGSSLGQFIIAPITQQAIQLFGWMQAMWAMAILSLAALPLVGKLTHHTSAVHAPAAVQGGLRQAIKDACKSPSYGLLHAGFFTCGFHIAFLVTHLPGEVDLCGLPPSVASWSLAIIGLANIAGSLYVGSCINRFRSKHILCVMYGSRALLVIWYLLMPKEAWVFYIFAAGLGFTWLATVPPTAAIVSKLFGSRYIATLFGLTLLSHQIGGFLGAWLGGLAIANYGDLSLMWYADIGLAAFAALVNLPIQEAPVRTLTNLVSQE